MSATEEQEVNAHGELLLVRTGITADGTVGSALLSKDLRYRYGLSRRWQDAGGLEAFPIVIMLNPSTADQETDDATIRRVRSLLKRDGWRGMTVVNLFAYRTRSPVKLLAADDPEGPANQRVVLGAVVARLPEVPVIAAWGSHGAKPRVGRVVDELTRKLADQEPGIQLQCWGMTQAGDPKHPLYLPGSTKLEPWREP